MSTVGMQRRSSRDGSVPLPPINNVRHSLHDPNKNIHQFQYSTPVNQSFDNDKQTPNQKVNTNDRYGNGVHLPGMRHGSLRPMGRTRGLSCNGENNTKNLIDEIMNSLGQNQKKPSYGVVKVSQSLLRETASLRIKNQIQQSRFKKPSNTLMGQLDRGEHNEDDEDEQNQNPIDEEDEDQMEKRKKKSASKLTKQQKEQIKLQQQIVLMQQWSKRLKLSKLLNQELNKEISKKQIREHIQQEQLQNQQKNEESNSRDGSQSPDQERKKKTKNDEKFKIIDNPYVSYQLEMLDKEQLALIEKKKKKIKRSKSDKDVKSRKNMTDIWKTQQESPQKPKELPHYMVHTYRGKQAEIEKQKKLEEIRNPSPKKEVKKLKMSEIWKKSENGEPVELPHYMQTTTSMVNYKNTLLQNIEENRVKTPKKVTPRKNLMEEQWKRQSDVQSETKNQDVPSYMKQTKSNETHLLTAKKEKEEQERIKLEKEKLAKEKVKKGKIEEVWNNQKKSPEELKQDQQSKQKYVPHKRAPIVKALIEKYPKQFKIWKKWLMNISKQAGSDYKRQGDENKQNGSLDMANYYYDKYFKIAESFYYDNEIVLQSSQIRLHLALEQLKQEKLFLADESIKKCVQLRSYIGNSQNNKDKDFIHIQYTMGYIDIKKYEKGEKKDDKLKTAAQNLFRDNCKLLQNNFSGDIEFCTEIIKDQCSHSIILDDLNFIKEIAQFGIKITQKHEVFGKYL